MNTIPLLDGTPLTFEGTHEELVEVAENFVKKRTGLLWPTFTGMDRRRKEGEQSALERTDSAKTLGLAICYMGSKPR